MSAVEYIELLDWLARQIAPGKRCSTPEETPAFFDRLGLGLSAGIFCELVANFGKLFKIVQANRMSSTHIAAFVAPNASGSARKLASCSRSELLA